jgi:predicted glycoside hydrolase/deacetylase ChbG (UPF0249 family)
VNLIDDHIHDDGLQVLLDGRIREMIGEAAIHVAEERDHVNAHHHLHLHPTVSHLLLNVGKEYGMKAMRLPYEPPLPSWRASNKAFLQRLAAWLFLFPY